MSVRYVLGMFDIRKERIRNGLQFAVKPVPSMGLKSLILTQIRCEMLDWPYRQSAAGDIERRRSHHPPGMLLTIQRFATAFGACNNRFPIIFHMKNNQISPVIVESVRFQMLLFLLLSILDLFLRLMLLWGKLSKLFISATLRTDFGQWNRSDVIKRKRTLRHTRFLLSVKQQRLGPPQQPAM